MDDLRIEVHESMVVLDGGLDAELPEGSGGPVLAGPEAVFVAGRVAADAPTVIRLEHPGDEGDLVLAYEGEIETPERRLRVANVLGDLLGEVMVASVRSRIQIHLSDFDEPDEILVVVQAQDS